MAMHEPKEDVTLTEVLGAWGKRKLSPGPVPHERRPRRVRRKTRPPELSEQVLNALPAPLSWREVQVLTGIGLGETCGETGARLHLSANTVKTHRNRIYSRLGIRSAGQAGALAAKAGLV